MIILFGICVILVVAFLLVMLLVALADDGDFIEEPGMRIMVGYICVICLCVICSLLFYNIGSGNEIGIIPLK